MVLCDSQAVSYQNCIIVSVAFFLIFSGYQGVQRFATSAGDGADERDTSIAIIYTVFPIATLFVGPIVKRISATKVFIAAASCYILYIAANIKVIPFILYACAAMVGVAAPCLWVARNVFITDCANQNEIFHHEALNSKLGVFNGIFWCLFQLSAILGSVMGALLFQLDGSVVYLYILFTIVCTLGVSTFFCIKPMDLQQDISVDAVSSASDYAEIQLINVGDHRKEQDYDPNIEDTHDENDDTIYAYNIMEGRESSVKNELIQSGLKFIHILKQFNLWCLLPFFMYSGLEIGFDSADFPLLIVDNTTKFYILGYYGFVSMIASYFVGKLSDEVHRSSIVLLLFVLHQLAWISLYFFADVIYELQSNVIFVVFTTIFGVGFAVIATQKFAMIPILLNNEPEAYQCVFLVESPSAAVVFYLHSHLSLSTKVIINSLTLCIAVIPFVCFPTIRNALKPNKGKATKNGMTMHAL